MFRYNNVFIYICSGEKTQVENVVVIDAADTDVVVLAAYDSHTIKGKFEIRRKGTVMDSPNNCSFSCQQWWRCGFRILWSWK